jgi:hypothetical protein
MKTKKRIFHTVLWVSLFWGATVFLTPGWSNATVGIGDVVDEIDLSNRPF